MSRKRKNLPNMDEHLDLVPLIDCVFLLLLFFMLCGRLSNDTRTEQITVPPTRTAVKFDTGGWGRVILNVFGNTQSGQPPRNSIAMGSHTPWVTNAADDYSAYVKLRTELNNEYDKAEKYDAPKAPGMKLPKVVIEIRADSHTEYRVIQEIQQILSDTIDPSNNMLPRTGVQQNQLKCFVNIDFTTRKPNDKL